MESEEKEQGPKRKGFPFGVGKDDPLVPPGDDCWQPMSEEELAEWYDGEIFPTDS